MKPLAFTILPLLFLAAGPATAATAYDSCTGFITALPAVVSAQGTWCLKNDLATAIGSGAAITVANNNVTIDCNEFKLGGLAAGVGTQAIGIRSDARLNTTVRNCRIRGFMTGIALVGDGGGHLVEDNVLEGSTFVGAEVRGDGSLIRRNRVLDTGGSTAFPWTATGVRTQDGVDVLDNEISDVASYNADAGLDSLDAIGILASGGYRSVVAGNRIRGMRAGPSGATIGIRSSTSRALITNNYVGGPGFAAVSCTSSTTGVWGNHFIDMTNPVFGGCVNGPNFVIP